MKKTMIPIVVGALGTVTKGLPQREEDMEIRGEVETILNTELLRFAIILRWVLVSWENLLSHELQ